MSKRLLLISNSTNYGEEYLAYTKPQIKNFLGKDIREVIFVPYAGVSVSYDEYSARVAGVFNKLGYEVKPVHRFEDPVDAIAKAAAIVVGGGQYLSSGALDAPDGDYGCHPRKSQPGNTLYWLERGKQCGMSQPQNNQ